MATRKNIQDHNDYRMRPICLNRSINLILAMNSTALFSKIKTLLFRLADDIESANSLHLHNDAIHAENFFCELLNLIFPWNLENVNQKKINQETFDLWNEGNEIFVQITSNKTHRTKYNKAVKTLTKQGSDIKYRNFYLFFIAQKVDTKILERKVIGGSNYEGWDITKLIEAIYYRKKSAKLLMPVFDLLDQELNSHFTSIVGKTKFVISPQQILKPISKNQFYIDRKSLTNQLFEFTQQDSGLITGGPGYGKSFTITELQRKYQQLGIACFVIRINEMIKGTSEELSFELGTTSNWLEALKSVPCTTGKSLLIFDAFDTAKDEEFKGNMLGHIKIAIASLGPSWHVVVSTRSYDALKSHRLAELFPKNATANAIGCRFIEIPGLTDNELQEAIQPHKTLKNSVLHANASLKNILKIPYFLSLFTQVVPNKEQLHIRTEEQLLTLYWNKRVSQDTAKDLFLRKLTSLLCTTENLSCRKSNVLTEQNITAYEGLLSDGLIAETSYTRENIAFAHNILLEYGLFKYALPNDIDEMINHLKANERQPFLFRSSYIFFYSMLWNYDRENFWQHYLKLRMIAEPLFRLFHQTILNYVLADNFNSVTDFEPLDNLIDDEEKSSVFRKILEAIRFIRPNSIQFKDIQLFLSLSKEITPASIWELGFLTEKSIKQYSADRKRLILLGQISYNYLEYFLTALGIPALKMRIEGNGQHWALRNYVSCLNMIPKPKNLLIRLLNQLKVPDFNIYLFSILADEIVTIAKYDLAFSFTVYKTLYDHIEISDKETYLGNSAVLSLKSNRKQDFHVVHHRLEAKFEHLLELNPKESIIFGLQIVDNFLLERKTYWRAPLSETLGINGLNAQIVEDGSVYDYKLEKRHGPLSHINSITKYLHRLVDEKELTVVNELLDVYMQNARSRMLWTRLLNFLQKRPEVNPTLSALILSNKGIYSSSKSREEIYKLLNSSWSLFTFEQKYHIETMIFSLPMLEYYDESSMNRLKGVLFSNIPEGELVLEQSIQHLKMTGKITKEESGRMESSISFQRSIAEEKQRLNIRDEIVAEHEAYNLIKEIEEFNDSHSNIQNRPKPIPKDYKPYLKPVKRLYELRSESFPERLREACDNEISRYLRTVLEKNKNVPESLKLWAEEVAFELIDEARYYSDNEVGELTNQIGAFSPSPRTYSTSILAGRLYETKKPAIAGKLILLMQDNTQRVRYLALRTLPYFYTNGHKEYWSTIEGRLLTETDGHCLHEIMHSMFFKDIIAKDTVKVVNALWSVSHRLHDNKVSNALENMFVHLLLEVILNHNVSRAWELAVKNADNEAFCREFILQCFGILDSKNKKKAVMMGRLSEAELYGLVEELIGMQFKIIQMLELDDPAISAPLHTIDMCIQQLFFKVEKEENNKSKQTILKLKRAYLAQIKSLLDLILSESKKLRTDLWLRIQAFT
ncbi:SMEK domain-containing protein [Chitinophaga sedimenti]|uniref:SMEK domain-containing protein n=1 Tax=Chitinophaga sedimenti TaxID=2033606 RepID=UPI00200440DA|nr:SMEK domain-containing protein [Chitinophaga sedimenti]MCK7556556.1 SMEK domain-containing protein [Chitinophaga sedimenti]